MDTYIDRKIESFRDAALFSNRCELCGKRWTRIWQWKQFCESCDNTGIPFFWYRLKFISDDIGGDVGGDVDDDEDLYTTPRLF